MSPTGNPERRSDEILEHTPLSCQEDVTHASHSGQHRTGSPNSEPQAFRTVFLVSCLIVLIESVSRIGSLGKKYKFDRLTPVCCL